MESYILTVVSFLSMDNVFVGKVETGMTAPTKRMAVMAKKEFTKNHHSNLRDGLISLRIHFEIHQEKIITVFGFKKKKKKQFPSIYNSINEAIWKMEIY